MPINHRSHVELFRIDAEKLLFYGTNPNATHITIASQNSTALDFENIDHIEMDDVRIKKLTHQVDDTDVITFNDNGKINFHSRVCQSMILDTPTINAGTINTATFYNGVIDYPDTSGYQNKVLTTDGNGTVVLSAVSVADLTTSDVADENLVDKTAVEGITGVWTFSADNCVFSGTNTLMKNIKYDGSDTFQFKDTDDSNNAKLTIDTMGIRTAVNTVNNYFQLANSNTGSGVGSSTRLREEKGLRFELYSNNNSADKDGLMLLVDNNRFSFLTNTDFNGANEVIQWASGEMLVLADTGLFIPQKLRIGGAEGTPTNTLDITGATPVCGIVATGTNQDAELKITSTGTGDGVISFNNDLLFKQEGGTQRLKLANDGTLTTGSITMDNGTTIVNTDADTLTITEARVTVAGILRCGSNIIENSTGGDIITLATGSSGLTTFAGNIKIAGGGSGFFIQNSGGNNVLSCDTTGAGAETRLYGDLRCDGDTIKSSTDDTVMSWATGSSPLVTYPGGLDVGSNAILCGSTTYSNGATIVNDSSSLLTITEATVDIDGNLTVDDDLTVDGDSTFNGDLIMGSSSDSIKTEIIRDLGGNTTIYLSNNNDYIHLYPRMCTFASSSATYRMNLYAYSANWTYHYNNALTSYEPAMASYDFYSNNSAQYQSSHTTVQSSDRRWKYNITDVDYDKFYDLYTSINPKMFKWNDKAPKKMNERNTSTDDGTTFGFIAQEVEKTSLKKMVLTDKLGNPQNNDMGFSKLMCIDCGKQCLNGEKDRCDEDCCKCDIGTRKEKEVWCNEACCGDGDNQGDIDSNCCEIDCDGTSGEGFKTISYGSLVPLNYIAINDIKSKYDKLKIDHDALKAKFEIENKNEKKRNFELELRLSKMETMCINIMTKIS